MKISIDMILAKQLKKLLIEKDISIAQLSRACKVSPKTLHDWAVSNRNPRNLNHLKAVADYLGVSLDYILFGIEVAKQENIVYDNMDLINAGVFEVILRRKKND